MSLQIHDFHTTSTLVKRNIPYTINDDFNTYSSGTTWVTKRGSPAVGINAARQSLSLLSGGRVAVESVGNMPSNFEMEMVLQSNNWWSIYWKMADVTSWDTYNGPVFSNGRMLYNSFTLDLMEVKTTKDSVSAIPANTWTKFKIRDVNNVVTVFMNDVQVLNYTMSPSSATAGDRIYIQNREMTGNFLYIDYIKVKEVA